MDQINFKVMLARIKEDFYSKIIAQKRSCLTIQNVAQLLYKYLNGQPLSIKQTLLRSTGKDQIVWDDLLSFLQQELSVLQTVKKIQYSPLSATQIIDRHTNQYGKLINYVKSKETNTIQSIHHLPNQVNGQKNIAICFEKQIVFFDCNHNSIINTISFKYAHVIDKIIEKQQQKKIQRLQNSQKINIQKSDKVLQIINVHQNKGHSQRPNNFISNNIKNSVRGSEYSSQKSQDKMMFRRTNTESNERRRVKSNVTKIKNDDVQKVFHFFQHSSLQNSINIAHAFVNSRNNFQKAVVLDNSFLEKEANQKNFDLSSVNFHKNYQREVVQMKKINKQLSQVQYNLKLSAKSRYESGLVQRRGSLYDRQSQYLKQKKMQNQDPLEMKNKWLEIINVCFYDNFLLISLFNREIRLFKLKKSLNRISEEIIFQKCYKEVVTFVLLYRSKNKQLFHVVVALQKQNQTQIIVYGLDSQMKLKEKMFEKEFPYSAKCQSILPFGIALYNELGYFSIVELNCSLDTVEQKLLLSTQLFNTETNYRISITQIRIDSKLSSIFISCSSGYIYLYDRYVKSIKYQSRICPFPVLDISLIHSDEELLVLYSNGNMAILSTFHLQKIFFYQAYGQISNQSKIFKGFQNNFYVYTTRAINPYSLNLNQEKNFNNIKSKKILKSRIKLKTKEKNRLQKSKVAKIIEGNGGDEDFLCIVLQKGQLLIFNSNLDYIGSYFYFNVMHIIQIYSNKCHQFLALTLDNNNIEIVNLYTQNLLFTTKLLENQLPTTNKTSKRPDSSLFSSAMGHKRTKKVLSGISLVHFMDIQISNCFLSVVSKSGKVNNYNQTGTLLSYINLQDKLGDKINGQMLYYQEQLIVSSENNLLILHRKSYNRKSIIKTGSSAIVKMKKCSTPYQLCILDSECNIFIVNTQSKAVKFIYQDNKINKYQNILFNQHGVLSIQEDKGMIKRIKEWQDYQFDVDYEKHIFSMIGKKFIQVHLLTGKINVFNYASAQFEQLIF